MARVGRAGALVAVCAVLALASPARLLSREDPPADSFRPGWDGKLDPFLRRLALGTSRVTGRFAQPIAARSSEALGSLPPFIRADRGAAVPAVLVKARLAAPIGASEGGWPAIRDRLEQAGGQVRGRVGEIVSLRVAVADLERLALLPEIAWMKAARSYLPLNEISTGSGQIGSDQANGSPLNIRGQGVIVGVVDTGIQWQDRDFRKTDGTTRILGIWDMTLTDPLHPPPPGFAFGAYYSAADIDAALAAGTTLMTGDGHGHGSHVAGSAAGNGLETGNGVPAGTFAGVAPEADLLIVRVFDDVGSFCQDCDLTAATQFIQETAAAAGKPWVGNMSLGDDLGAHDGTDPDELAISDAVGPGRRGAQMAIAAGNSDTRRMHWEGTLAAGGTLTNTFCVGTGITPPSCGSFTPRGGSDNDFIWMDLWYKGADRATFEIVTPGGTTVTAAPGADSGVVCTTSGTVQIDATNLPDPANGDNEVFIQIWDSGACGGVNLAGGAWTMRIRGDSVASASREFDLWNEADLGTQNITHASLASFTQDEMVGIPGTSRHAITAAAFTNKTSWVNVHGTTTTGSGLQGDIASFSSRGPTRDGRIKPDIGAPGRFVGSSLAGSIIEGGILNPACLAAGTCFSCERDGKHGVISGTSMATPHVAGAVALLLSLNPDLQGPEVKAAIQRSARVDSFTGAVPNTRFGAGKLRALEAGLQAASIVTDLGATSSADFTATDNPLVDFYNVYRGTIPGLSATDHGCRFLTGLPSPSFTDAEVPPPGQAFTYLVAGVQGGIEGILGTDSSGNVIPAGPPCP